MSDYPIYFYQHQGTKRPGLLINVFLQIFGRGMENKIVVSEFTCYSIQKYCTTKVTNLSNVRRVH